MKTQATELLEEIERSLREKRDAAKRFADRARAESNGKVNRLECEWAARADAYSTALRVVRNAKWD